MILSKHSVKARGILCFRGLNGASVSQNSDKGVGVSMKTGIKLKIWCIKYCFFIVINSSW
jgi:hypothetical protein